MKDRTCSYTFYDLSVSQEWEDLSLQISARRQIITSPENASVWTMRTVSRKWFLKFWQLGFLFCATGVRVQRSSLAFSPHSLVNAMISTGPCTSQSVKDIIGELIGSSSALSVTTQPPTHKPRKTINKPLRINNSQKYKRLVKERFQMAWVGLIPVYQ